ncbi:hypothetical protein BX600DRAFT_108423 [Xylariales sp. PMI_506]|nr:hypothetical protein BX600DRAFT_108423 [Xylariales sp. PMI_506]
MPHDHRQIYSRRYPVRTTEFQALPVIITFHVWDDVSLLPLGIDFSVMLDLRFSRTVKWKKAILGLDTRRENSPYQLFSAPILDNIRRAPTLLSRLVLFCPRLRELCACVVDFTFEAMENRFRETWYFQYSLPGDSSSFQFMPKGNRAQHVACCAPCFGSYIAPLDGAISHGLSLQQAGSLLLLSSPYMCL